MLNFAQKFSNALIHQPFSLVEKNMLKVTQKNIITVHDFNKLVQNTYGKYYHFQQQEGCKSRGYCDITVPGDGAL